MNDRFERSISAWLDDSEDGRTDGIGDVVNLTNSDIESLAETVVIHGLLSDISERKEDHEAERIRILLQRIDSDRDPEDGRVEPAGKPLGRRPFTFVTSAVAIAAAVMVMFVVFAPNRNISAAMVSLERVMEAAARPFDRTFNVRLVEEYPRDKRPQNLSKAAWEREAPEQIDGAKIYVRSVNEYVMEVSLKTGVKRTSGCDGKQSWSFRENGPVHVSDDMNRFRGGMPGNQQDMPFMNIHANLSQLKIGYDVELADTQETTSAGIHLSRLICVRKSREVRGIKRVEIWFDLENGTIHKMLLDGLPRGRGGPKSVMLELIDHSQLPANFFSHDAHHEPGRRVREEGDRR